MMSACLTVCSCTYATQTNESSIKPRIRVVSRKLVEADDRPIRKRLSSRARDHRLLKPGEQHFAKPGESQREGITHRFASSPLVRCHRRSGFRALTASPFSRVQQ